MSYKITIEKIETEAVVVRGQWVVVDKRPYTQKEADNCFHGFDPNEQTKDVMGYAPDVEKTITEETKVFEQTISNIDLNKVIKAINNIG